MVNVQLLVAVVSIAFISAVAVVLNYLAFAGPTGGSETAGSSFDEDGSTAD